MIPCLVTCLRQTLTQLSSNECVSSAPAACALMSATTTLEQGLQLLRLLLSDQHTAAFFAGWQRDIHLVQCNALSAISHADARFSRELKGSWFFLFTRYVYVIFFNRKVWHFLFRDVRTTCKSVGFDRDAILKLSRKSIKPDSVALKIKIYFTFVIELYF